MKTKAKYDDAIRTAINACVNSADGARRGFTDKISRRVNLSKKPWFLIDGPQGAGKSSFIAGSGTQFEFIGPDGGAGPRLFLAANALYIDPPGTLAHTPDDGFGAFCRRLLRHKLLRRRALGGLLAVADLHELSETDAASVDRIAAGLRARADAAALATGYEIPVYFVFSKVDLFDGFTEFFGDRGTAGRLPFLGATFGNREGETPATAFALRHREICGELSDICVRRVAGAGAAGHYDKNGRLYRFLTRLELAEAPLAAFLTEFFRPRARNDVSFGGFFFTSSNKNLGGAPAAALSRKIVDEAIPKAQRVIRAAADGTLPCYMRKAGSYALMALLWAAFVLLFAGGGLRDAARARALQSELSEIFESGAGIANRFAALEKLRVSYEYFGGTLKRPCRLLFGTGTARDAALRAYVAASERALVEPAARYLETSVKHRTTPRPDGLATAERLALHRELEAYLLLTGGNRMNGVNADSVSRTVAAAFNKIPGAGDEVVMANIFMTVKLAAGGNYKNVPVNQAVIEAARGMLAAAPKAAAVYVAVMDRLSAAHRPVEMSQITGGGGLLKYGRDVSGLYTRGGWESAVLPEFIKASKAPIKADWVTGPAATVQNEEKLLTELASLYADDLGRRWLDFIRNTYINIQPGLPSLARDLDLLAARGCEVERMLAAVCSLATQQPSEISLSQVSAKSATSIKGQVTGAVNKLRGAAAGLSYDMRDPFAEARAASFAQVEAFLKNGALDAYRGGLAKLAEKIRQCGDRNGYAAFVTRGTDDPLRECRLALDRAWASMPPHVSAPLKRITEPALDAASAALTKAVTEETEESWNAEVVNFYNARLADRYPVNRKGNDVSWADFEEFFKPQSGILWKYRDKNLSGIVERTSRGWEGAGRSMALPLSLNDEIPRCLNAAERIADNFFKKDGAPKRHELIFLPIKSSSGEVVLIAGDKQFDFKTGLPVTISRRQGDDPVEPLTLRLTTADKTQEEMRFTGEWSPLRLFDPAKIDKMGNDRYRINWRMNVRGIYTANISAVVQSNTGALFDSGITEGFAVPKRVFRND